MVKDGPQCPGCGLPNYEGLCPQCRGDQVAYESELVPPFVSSKPIGMPELLEGCKQIRAMYEKSLKDHDRRSKAINGFCFDCPGIVTDFHIARWQGISIILEAVIGMIEQGAPADEALRPIFPYEDGGVH